MHRLAHPDGELATSRAAAKANICMALSSYATESLEDVASQGNGNPYAMQLCVLRDRHTTLQMLERAEGMLRETEFRGLGENRLTAWSLPSEAAGYKAIFLSVDTPLLGRRLNEYRNSFVLPDDMAWPNLLSDGKSELSGAKREDEGANRHDFGMHMTLPMHPSRGDEGC